MTDTADSHLRHVLQRFHAVALKKFSRITDVYDGHEVEADDPRDNRAVAQCHSAGRSILVHLTTLRKALLDNASTEAAVQAAPREIGAAELQAMIEDARDHV